MRASTRSRHRLIKRVPARIAAPAAAAQTTQAPARSCLGNSASRVQRTQRDTPKAPVKPITSRLSLPMVFRRIPVIPRTLIRHSSPRPPCPSARKRRVVAKSAALPTLGRSRAVSPQLGLSPEQLCGASVSQSQFPPGTARTDRQLATATLIAMNPSESMPRTRGRTGAVQTASDESPLHAIARR
jgi:hypothetical protein